MEGNLPTWLDHQFLAAVLQGGEDEKPRVTVVNFHAEPAVPPGNNYLSYIYRVLVQYTTGESSAEEKKTLIVKLPGTGGMNDALNEQLNIFETERNVYNKLLTNIYKRSKHSFSPASFYCPIEKGLILEDLKVDGYVMRDKFKQLDYAHCKRVILEIATFHANSVACYNENQDSVRNLGNESIYLDGKFKSWHNECVKSVVVFLKKTDGCSSLAKHVLSRVDTFWESEMMSCLPKTKGLNVVNHGDLWTNNILFKYNGSHQLVDVKLIDFQLSRWASPVADLLFFLWVSGDEYVRQHHVGELTDLYLQTLNYTLRQLGCPQRMSQEELQEDIRAGTDYILMMICYMIPFIMTDPELCFNFQNYNPEDFMTGKALKGFEKMLYGKHVITLLSVILKQFHAAMLT